jgi:two-component system, LytTR family, sensor kinase
MLEQHLVTLLVKLAVAASMASILVRSNRFLQLLMREDRTLRERMEMMLTCSAFFGAGVATRLLTHGAYRGVDLGLEGSFILGLVGGYVTGLTGGMLISLPAMFGGELMTMLVFAAVGVLGGLLRDLAPDAEDIWRFSPWFDLNVYRLFVYRLFRGTPDNLRKTAFSLTCGLTVILAEALRISIAAIIPNHGIFSLYHELESPHPVAIIALFATTVFAVTLPLKIWNNSRNEKKLESQQLLLNEARLTALQRQINPHFLFNTLNSVTALIRSNPDQARTVIYKLSAILRRLLRKQENFTPLREELSFIDDYLAIEMVRFGDKLRFKKEVDPDTLDRPVPSMLLQPLIENSIRHGLSSKVDGGMIRVRTHSSEGRLLVIVEDDGVGIPENRLATLFESGIGVSNVNERLKVLFGNDYRMWVDSKPGEGTTTGIEIPLMKGSLAVAS